METYFHEKELTYSGEQLTSHFSLKNFKIMGDSLVAFIGRCDVSGDNLVDMEEVLASQRIYSPKMLHFIGEFFGMGMREVVLWQYILVSLAMSGLISREKGLEIERDGDDLYVGERKLSISVATVSPVSALLHLGINIDTKGIEFPTIGLTELGVNPGEFALWVLEAFVKEVEGVRKAMAKVRWVE